MRTKSGIFIIACIITATTNTALGATNNTGGTAINTRNIATGAVGAVGLVAGASGVIDSASGTSEHSWGDVLQGAVSGATAAAGGAALVNAIPGIGQVGYGIAVAGGTALGALVAGSQLFSETDCLYDPVTGAFTCCNTVFNKGERLAKIGDYMFCGSPADSNSPTTVGPMVRQCLQGNMNKTETWSDTAANWWNGLFRDDFWAPECVVRYCDNEIAPQVGIDQYVQYIPNTTNYCYTWSCIDGYTRSGDTCVSTETNQPAAPYTRPGAGTSAIHTMN